MDLFLRRQDKAVVKAVFDKHCSAGEQPVIDKLKLGECLKALGLCKSEAEIQSDFEWADVDAGGGIDEEELYRLVQRPSAAEESVAALPLTGLLASCMSFKGGQSGQRTLEELTEADVDKV